MNTPRAVVIPFGVPEIGRGLGVGLAALVHSIARIEDGRIAIAQLQVAASHPGSERAPGPLEAYFSASAWRDMAALGDAPSIAGVVLTGSFEPPFDGEGGLRILAFDPSDGRARAALDVTVDGPGAGAGVVGALDRICTTLGGHLGVRYDLCELGWEPLESVLRAEACALYDPARRGPRDRLAAMLYLGRALDDAPQARYPAERLAAIATEAVSRPAASRAGAAALRALERAAADPRSHVAIDEALAAVLLRMGRIADAERRLNAAIAVAPHRRGLYVLLSQALKAQGLCDAALGVLDEGAAAAGDDPILAVERGDVLFVKGDLLAAAGAWRGALLRGGLPPGAFVGLGRLALRAADTRTAQWLVDSALGAGDLHPDVARYAVHLVLATESHGVARAARLAHLAHRWLECAPEDPSALLVLARARVVLGELAEARARLDQIERVAPQSQAAAEVRVLRLELDDPSAALDLDRVLRAAQACPEHQLPDVSGRARRLATLHDAWVGWLAAGIAERRRARWPAALQTLELALDGAPGAAAVHVELARVLLSLERATRAVEHAQRAAALDTSPVVLGVLARALDGAGRVSEAIAAARAGLALQPDSAELQRLVATLAVRATPPPPRWAERTRRTLRRAWANLSRFSDT